MDEYVCYYYGRLVSKEYEYEFVHFEDYCVYTEKNIKNQKLSLIQRKGNQYIDVETNTALTDSLEKEIIYSEVDDDEYKPKRIVLYAVCDLEVAYAGRYFSGLLEELYGRLYLKNNVLNTKIKKKELK